MFYRNVRTLLFASALAAAVLPVVMPTATAAEDVKQIAVHYSDLNLETKAGVARLYSRLQRAARLVCDDADMRLLAQKRHLLACERQALDRAVAAANVEALSQLHVERNPVRLGGQSAVATAFTASR